MDVAIVLSGVSVAGMGGLVLTGWRKSVSIAAEFGSLREGVATVLDSMKAIHASHGELVSVLAVRESLSGEDVTKIQRSLVDRTEAAFDHLIKKMRPGGNPVSVEGLEQVQELLDKARRGDRFTPEEARRFVDLADMLAKENPKFSGLANMAQFILGVAEGPRTEKP